MNYERLNHCRPGVTRLSFPYFMSRASMDYVIKAVAMVAKHGWKLLPQVGEPMLILSLGEIEIGSLASSTQVLLTIELGKRTVLCAQLDCT